MLGAWHINLLHSSSISSCILRQKNISDTSMLIQGFLDSWPHKEGIQKELAEQIFLRILKRSFRERFIAHNLIFLEVKNLEVGDGHMAQIQEMPCRSHRRYLHLPKDPLGLFQGGLRRPPTEVTKNTIAEGTNDCYQLLSTSWWEELLFRLPSHLFSIEYRLLYPVSLLSGWSVELIITEIQITIRRSPNWAANYSICMTITTFS